MREEIETPLSEEEQALARRGQELIAPAVGGVRAPRSLREAIERLGISIGRDRGLWGGATTSSRAAR
jgi:hypothetical protein